MAKVAVSVEWLSFLVHLKPRSTPSLLVSCTAKRIVTGIYLPLVVT
jgi:hypothetical protein